MRVPAWLAAGLVCLAGGVAAATPAAAAPPFGASLTLDPPSGKASTTITATFQIDVPDNVRCHMRVTFRWDDHTLGQKGADSCKLTVHLKAPHDGRDQGQHVVTAIDGVTHLDASAIFVVTNGDATDPTATPTPHSTLPTADPSIAAGPPLPVDTATVNPAAVAPPVPQLKSSSSTFTSVALIFGGVLLLGGVVILVLVILRMRRGDGEPDFDDEPLPVPVTAPFGGGYPTQRFDTGVERTQVFGYPHPPEVDR